MIVSRVTGDLIQFQTNGYPQNIVFLTIKIVNQVFRDYSKLYKLFS